MTRLMTTRLPQVFGPKVFDSIWDNWPLGSAVFDDSGSKERVAQVTYPRIDITESDDKLVVIAEIPGMKREDISVIVQDERLTISGERSAESKEKGEGFLRREISHASFKRSFILPDSVDVEKIDAKYQAGVLTIEFAKTERAKPKQIEVQVR